MCSHLTAVSDGAYAATYTPRESNSGLLALLLTHPMPPISFCISGPQRFYPDSEHGYSCLESTLFYHCCEFVSLVHGGGTANMNLQHHLNQKFLDP